jgi:serine protease Do
MYIPVMILLVRGIALVVCALLALPSLAQSELIEGKLPTLAPLVREVTPSVVNISVNGGRVRERDRVFNGFGALPKEIERHKQGVGSGVIVDAQRGYVLTASHVVEQAATVQVTMKDGRQIAAKILGRDPGTDLAVLRLEGGQSLKALSMGDSDVLEVGDFVVAVGNPFGLGQTVTSGLVSALGRTDLGTEGYEEFIQTDAAINPGNSGGALVNLRGQLIGINTAIFSPAGGNIGIGFAVPINMARRVMEQIVQHGSVRRGRIGLSIRDITPADGASAATSDQGAVIGNISRGSPAEQGGLQNGDIVVSADGTPISSAARLRNKLGLTPIGEHVQLTVRRSGVTRNFIVQVAPDSRDSREPAPTQTRSRAAFRGSQP